MELCPDQCLRHSSIHEKCCGFTCTCCDVIRKFNNCISPSGCDVIVIIDNDIIVIDLKSGRLGRDDAKDAINELKTCIDYVKSRVKTIRTIYAVIYYGKRVDDTARNYIYREKHELKRLNIPVVLCKCNEDLCKLFK